MTNAIKKTLLASGAALLLSASVAAAAPATARADLNVRSGPGAQYPVVGSIQTGETVDVGGCTGSWCQVSFSGGSGFANRSYLAMAGGGPGVGVAVAPVYDDYAYDDSYDYGYSYGPSVGVGFYGGSRFHHRRHHWDGTRTGTWQGRPGGWTGTRTGTWQGRPGAGPAQPGSVSPQVSSPTGMRGADRGPGGGAPAPAARPGGGGGGGVQIQGNAATGFTPGGAGVGARGNASQFGVPGR